MDSEWKKKLPAEGAAGGAGFDTEAEGFFSSGGDTFKYKMTINKPTFMSKKIFYLGCFRRFKHDKQT